MTTTSLKDQLTFERATMLESKKVIELLQALYIELGEEAESLDYLNDQLIERIISGGTCIFLVNKKTETIGIFTVTASQAIYAGGDYGSIDEMYIKPSHRSRGIGNLVIEKIIDMAREKNWRRVEVTAPTEAKWIRTVQFYERSGFKFTGPKLKIIL